MFVVIGMPKGSCVLVWCGCVFCGFICAGLYVSVCLCESYPVIIESASELEPRTSLFLATHSTYWGAWVLLPVAYAAMLFSSHVIGFLDINFRLKKTQIKVILLANYILP